MEQQLLKLAADLHELTAQPYYADDDQPSILFYMDDNSDRLPGFSHVLLVEQREPYKLIRVVVVNNVTYAFTDHGRFEYGNGVDPIIKLLSS